MAIAVEETALAVKKEESFELSTSSKVAEVTAEVQASILIAKNFPRDEDEAFEKLTKACKRTSFAETASWNFPRGGKQLTGPSINIAREAARVWKNIEYGKSIVHDDEETRTIKVWAWDKESNNRSSDEDTFKKLVYRKAKGWIKPDERDLRELTNRRASILKRNCLLELLPKDLIEDGLRICKETLRSKAAQDPDSARKAIILAFSELNITPEMLEKKLGHKIAQCIPDEIAELRQIHQSIKDGNSKWSEYIIEPDTGGNGGNGNKKTVEKGSLSMADLKPKQPDTEIKEITPRQELADRLTVYFGEDIDAKDKWFLENTGKATEESLSDKEVETTIKKLIKLMGS